MEFLRSSSVFSPSLLIKMSGLGRGIVWLVGHFAWVYVDVAPKIKARPPLATARSEAYVVPLTFRNLNTD